MKQNGLHILVHDVSDRTRRESTFTDGKLAVGDVISAFGRSDALVQVVHENCPRGFDQFVEVLVLDERGM